MIKTICSILIIILSFIIVSCDGDNNQPWPEDLSKYGSLQFVESTSIIKDGSEAININLINSQMYEPPVDLIIINQDPDIISFVTDCYNVLTVTHNYCFITVKGNKTGGGKLQIISKLPKVNKIITIKVEEGGWGKIGGELLPYDGYTIAITANDNGVYIMRLEYNEHQKIDELGIYHLNNDHIWQLVGNKRLDARGFANLANFVAFENSICVIYEYDLGTKLYCSDNNQEWRDIQLPLQHKKILSPQVSYYNHKLIIGFDVGFSTSYIYTCTYPQCNNWRSRSKDKITNITLAEDYAYWFNGDILVQNSENESWSYFTQLRGGKEAKMCTTFLNRIYYGYNDDEVAEIGINGRELIGNTAVPSGICTSCKHGVYILTGNKDNNNIYIISEGKNIYKGAKNKSWQELPLLPNPYNNQYYRPILIAYNKNHLYALQAFVNNFYNIEQLYVYVESSNN